MGSGLLGQVQIFMKSAELVYHTQDYTSATILYFKALFVALDLVILRRIKKTPKDHSERFRILEQYFPEEYRYLDQYFSIYQSTYTITVDKETCEEIRAYVTNLVAKNIGI